MKAVSFFAYLLALTFFTGCGTQDRHLTALGHPLVNYGLIGDIFEKDLRRFLATRERKDAVLYRLRGQTVERVPNEAYLDRFNLTLDGQPTRIPPAIREHWKQEYRLSADTYAVFAEATNKIILYFDQSGHLRQYEHPY